MIRVLHVTVSLGAGGVEKLLADHLPLLDPARAKAEVLLLKHDGFRAAALRAAGVPVRALDGGWRDPSLPCRFKRAVEEARCDVIHAHLTWPSVLAAWAKGRSRLVWHVHDTGESLTAFQRLAERAAIGRSDAVVAISRAVAEAAERMWPAAAGRVRVIRNAVRTGPEPAPRPAGRPPTILFLGRLDEPKKGIAVLLRAARRVEARIVIAGDGPAGPSLRKLAKELGVEGRVEWAGEVRDLTALLAGADVLAMPSLWEGFGVALLEAMNAGLPVVASRVGGIPEVVAEGETGALVPPGDPEALAGALNELLADPEKRRRWGEAGRRRAAAEFDARRSAEEWTALYEELVSG